MNADFLPGFISGIIDNMNQLLEAGSLAILAPGFFRIELSPFMGIHTNER
jgi:hypothetical protein